MERARETEGVREIERDIQTDGARAYFDGLTLHTHFGTLCTPHADTLGTHSGTLDAHSGTPDTLSGTLGTHSGTLGTPDVWHSMHARRGAACSLPWDVTLPMPEVARRSNVNVKSS